MTLLTRAARHSPDGHRQASRAAGRALDLLPVSAILIGQALLSARLIHLSVASADESVYIYGGHQFIHELWHGGASPYFGNSFPGAPALYPVLAAMADAVGGLAAVRLMSLAFMLAATGLLYGTARRVFGHWPAVLAAGLFIPLGATQLLGASATPGALALMLVASAGYCAARAAADTPTAPRWLLLIPPALLAANAVLYTSVLFDPVVAGMAAVLVSRQGWKRVLQRSAALSAATALLLVVAIFLAGAGDLKVILSTMLTSRLDGLLPPPPAGILTHGWDWFGFIICLGVLAVMIAAPLPRESSHLGLLLLPATATLVTIEYLRLRTFSPPATHEDIGAWFTCVAGGFAGARAVGLLRSWRPRAVLIAATSAALSVTAVVVAAQGSAVLARANAGLRYAEALQPYLTSPSQNYLLNGLAAERVPYLLHLPIPWTHAFNGSYIRYRAAGDSGRPLEGLAGYQAAIRQHFFAVVSIRSPGYPWAQAELQAVRSTPGYVPVSTVGGLTFINVADFRTAR